MSAIRIGHGYDVHRIENGDGIQLGGVHIPCPWRLIAHSDGDVALHALCDAMLGALALGDIGKHFPDTDPQYSGADSRDLLRYCNKLVAEHGYHLGNVDITIAAQQPKLAPYILAMRESIATVLDVAVSEISVKATTTEKLGFVGRSEGIAVDAVLLLERSDAA
ncbi:2-C-methyl-D-erythritol 2,4-cyclodiphosphate synthase [Zhongshania aliphaticivorans]|uniref:2-C-methyl-D-erythritol 2,4-cyclodiphosphate synthase n=1 Tax=Zhongshania aliphaticivorans TaxID=1470434 RepID=A0A5S9P2D4_9GAMM|nr:2-C-methyl-D-erythritol 2,4-cyclodiphosphate synthase [Zhongshania aliphaticivorans]CAA0090128.1 2-C-methyl-D-erythritol 2,4-cyclodiphosphate synthase [Zhongshania aliphaticivorans]CAA0097458.1 2-C-methyl-D-erythritol 2,4-cyclodiphosphate synthase [Zhongshania aliphaticivorans]